MFGCLALKISDFPFQKVASYVEDPGPGLNMSFITIYCITTLTNQRTNVFFPHAKTLHSTIPIGSMYGIFTYIYHKNQPNVGVYTSPMDPMGYANPPTPTLRPASIQPTCEAEISAKNWSLRASRDLTWPAMEAAARKEVTGMSQELRIKG